MKMNSTQFKATWDRRLSVTSALVTLIFVLVVLQTIALSSRLDAEAITWRIGLVIVLGLSSALFFIRKYSVTSDFINIHHLGWSTSLKIQDLTEIEKVPIEGKGGIGLFGIWGVYSFTGIARSNAYGFHKLYMTNQRHAVALKFGKKTVLLSPDNPEKFIAILQSRLT